MIILFCRCDVTNKEAVKAMGDQIRREHGDVTMLLNNAGIMPCKPLLQHSEKEIRNVFEINILAHHWVSAFIFTMLIVFC